MQPDVRFIRRVAQAYVTQIIEAVMMPAKYGLCVTLSV